jgi:hypothetical protein
MSFLGRLFGLGSSATTDTGSSSEADKKRDEMSQIFNGLIRNTNEIDIDKLTNPNLCNQYVFQLHRAFQDMQEARKSKELKTLVMDSKDSSDSFESIVFHPIKRKRPTDNEICKEMSVFYIELIFLLYTVVLSTGKQYVSPAGILEGRRGTLESGARRTRRRQRGGARPFEDLISFLDREYSRPSSNFFQNPDPYRQLYPRVVDESIPNELVVFQRPTSSSISLRYIDFWVYLQGRRTVENKLPIQFFCEFDNADSAAFMMTIYRCAVALRHDKSFPVLRINASITQNRDYSEKKFSFNLPSQIMSGIYSISEPGPYSFEHIVRILLTAAKADIRQISTNKNVILDQGRSPDLPILPLGRAASGSEVSSTGSTEFSTTASKIRAIMAVNKFSLYEIRMKMLKPDGDRVEPMNTSLKTDHITTVAGILARGVSYFQSNPVVITRLAPLLDEFNKLRQNNERIFNTLSGRSPRLSQQRIDQLTVLRNKITQIHNTYTITVGKIITSKVVKFEEGNYKINPDFTIVTETRLSTLKKIDRVVEEIAELMLKYYIDIERVFAEALSTTLSYTGAVI